MVQQFPESKLKSMQEEILEDRIKFLEIQVQHLREDLTETLEVLKEHLERGIFRDAQPE